MGCKNYGPLLYMYPVHIAIATEVIQLPCSGKQAFFINVEVLLVTLTDESTLASNIGNMLYLCLLLYSEGIAFHCFIMHCYM